MRETAYFAAGCFWGVEQAFRQTKGVTDTEVGYTAGHANNPNYEQVCAKKTGHAEGVKVTYDPTVISYEQLLTLFWEIHDPTQVNRQGPDIGDQYRSGIYTVNDNQLLLAQKSRDAENKSERHKAPIATQIETLRDWWPAEDYHQQYFEKRGGGACNLH